MDGTASTNRLITIVALSTVATGSIRLGGGPQGFDHPRRHHTIEPTIQHPDETAVAANAC